jgi:Uncharacterised nucleotidyltransferase
MPESIVPIAPLLPGACIEDQILLRAVRACILPRAPRVAQTIPAGVDWRDLGKVATRNKMATFLLRGLDRSAGEVPQEFWTALEKQQQATVHVNTRNLMTLRLLVSTLEAHQADGVIFKGPCAQMLVHGDFFMKPSSDVDLLVSGRDFDKAGRIIADSGFAVAEECMSPWWKLFLGEQHFLTANPSLTPVDLHYRTQQPGCPAPRRADAFLSGSVTVMVGGKKVPTLSRTNSTLLSCMSLVKALVHREPAGGHVCDIVAGVAGHSQEDVAQLVKDADRLGLRNTLALGLRSARLLFGLHTPMEGDHIVLRVADADLRGMILRPWSSDILWRRRSRTLWDLCDNEVTYLKEICWKIAGELCYMLYQRPRRARMQS